MVLGRYLVAGQPRAGRRASTHHEPQSHRGAEDLSCSDPPRQPGLRRDDAEATPRAGAVFGEELPRMTGRFFQKGEEICRVADTRQLLLRLQVPEREIGDVGLGHPVRLKVRSFPDLAGSLHWLREPVCPYRRRSPSPGGLCLLRAVACWPEFSPAHQQFWPGSFIFAQLRAEDSSPMESTTS